jgi:hypothetical protein
MGDQLPPSPRYGFLLPFHPKDWQLVYRLHHRSGVFGLMGADNASNTVVQLGVRHYFK